MTDADDKMAEVLKAFKAIETLVKWFDDNSFADELEQMETLAEDLHEDLTEKVEAYQ